jgi:hypothetical protein
MARVTAQKAADATLTLGLSKPAQAAVGIAGKLRHTPAKQ